MNELQQAPAVSERWPAEWIEFLNELRVALPGVQLLFAFLLTAPFTAAFQKMPQSLRAIYFACFLCTTAACAFLIAPSVYHRLHWRRDVADKEQMFRTCNRLVITGVVLLAGAMSSAVFMCSQLIFGQVAAWSLTAAAVGMFAWLWFALPLSRRVRQRRG